MNPLNLHISMRRKVEKRKPVGFNLRVFGHPALPEAAIWWRIRDLNPGPADYDYDSVRRTEYYTHISIGRQGGTTKKYLTVYLTRNTIIEHYY